MALLLGFDQRGRRFRVLVLVQVGNEEIGALARRRRWPTARPMPLSPPVMMARLPFEPTRTLVAVLTMVRRRVHPAREAGCRLLLSRKGWLPDRSRRGSFCS